MTDAGPGLCADVDCSAMDDACHVGNCDPEDGSCVATPVSEGTACDDGEACTGGDVCTAGVCAGVPACASTLAFTPSDDTAVQGGASTRYDDDCPAGQVLIGLDGTVGGSFDQLNGVCGTPSVSGSADALVVTIVEGDALPSHGRMNVTAVSTRCPTDQVVVGFEGTAGLLIDSLALHCAPLVVTGNSVDGYVVAPGTVTTQPAISGAGSSGAFTPTDCAAGDIATGTIIQAGNSIDGFGLRCSTPSAS